MAARHPERIETGVTARVPAHHDHASVEQNVWAFVEGHESARPLKEILERGRQMGDANDSMSATALRNHSSHLASCH